MAISGPTSAINFLSNFLKKFAAYLSENVTLIIFTYLKSWINKSS